MCTGKEVYLILFISVFKKILGRLKFVVMVIWAHKPYTCNHLGQESLSS